MSSEYKVKGHRRGKPSTPYQRPEGVVARVKNWLSPAKWSGYFNTNPSPGQQGSLSEPRPLTSEADTNTADELAVGGPPCPVVSGHMGESVSTAKTDLMRLQEHLPHEEPLDLMDEAPREAVEDAAEEEAVEMEGQGDASQDDSWVAEDMGGEEEEEGGGGCVLEIKPMVEVKGRDEGSTANRPRSILLAGEVSLGSSDSSPSSTPSSALPFSQLGDGEVGVVQHSSLLLTPGAEAPVLRVANPIFASQLPRMPMQGDVGAELSATPKREEGAGSSEDSEFTWSLPRPVGQSPRLQAGMSRGGNGGGGTLSTYTVTLTRPLMASTVVKSKLSKALASFSEQSKSEVSMTTSVAATPSKTTTPSVERSHLQATLNKSSLFPTSLVNSSSKEAEESIRRSPFHSPFYSGRTMYGGAASNQKMRFKRQRSTSACDSSIRLPVRARVQPSNAPDKAPSLLSSTARKILDSLQSSTSPLKDVRRMPIRQLSDDDLVPTKRRRVVPSPNSSLMSPSLVSPVKSFPSTSPQLNKPSPPGVSKKAGRQVAPDVTPSTGQLGLPSATLPPLPVSSTSLPSLNLPKFSSSTPKPASALSGLTFKPVPPTFEPKSSARSDRDEDTAPSSRMGGRSSGKLRVGKQFQKHFSRRTDDDEADGNFVNPLPIPPSVGLKLPMTASFSFHAQGATPSSSVPKAPVSSHDSSDYSFSPPRVISTSSSSVTTTKSTALSSSFVFSTPKSHVLSPLVTFSTRDGPPSTAPSSSSTALPSTTMFTSKLGGRLSQNPPSGLAIIKHCPPPTATEKAPPPLLLGSVEDALKSMSKTENSGRKETSAKEAAGSGLKPAPFSTAGTSLVAKFAPAPGSWECDMCMVRNKEESTSCVSCSSPKPGAQQKSGAGAIVSLSGQQPSSGHWTLGTGAGTAIEIDASLKLGTKGGLQLGSGGLKLGGLKFGIGQSLSKPQDLESSAPPLLSGSIADTLKNTNKKENSQCNKGALGSGLIGINQVENKPAPSTAGTSLAAKFTPAPGSWECDMCMVRNKEESTSCVSCSSPKPGAQQKFGAGASVSSQASVVVPSSSLSGQPSSGLKLGTGGLQLGSLKLGTKGGLQLGTEGSLTLGTKGGLQLGTEGSLKLGTKGGLQLGTEGSLKLGTKGGQLGTEGSLKLGTKGGLQLGSGGLKFGIGQSLSKPQGLESSAPLLSEGVPDGLKSMSKADSSGRKETSEAAGSGLKPAPSTTAGTSLVTKFAPAPGSWECDVCMVRNKEESTSCVSCSSPKPGAQQKSGAGELNSSLLSKLSAPNSSGQQPSGGIKFSSGGGAPLGTEGSFKLGASGGLQLGSGALTIRGQGLKFGSSQTASSSSGSSLQFGSGALTIGGQGLKFGSSQTVSSSGGSSLQFGSGALTIGGQGLKFGSLQAAPSSSGSSISFSAPAVTGGGTVVGGSLLTPPATGAQQKSGTEGESLTSQASKIAALSGQPSSGLKFGIGGSGSLGTDGSQKFGTGSLQLGTGGLQLGTESRQKLGTGDLQLGTEGSQKLGTGGLPLGTKLGTGGLQLGTKLGTGGLQLGTKLGTGGLQLGTEGSQKLGIGGLQLGSGALKLGGQEGFKFGSAQMAPSFSSNSPFSTPASTASQFPSLSNTQSLESSSHPFGFGAKLSSQSDQASLGTAISVATTNSSSLAPGLLPSTSTQNPIFSFKGSGGQVGSNSPNMNFLSSSGNPLGSFSTSSGQQLQQGFNFTPASNTMTPRPTFFGSGSTGDVKLGGQTGGQAGSPFKFQSNQPNPFTSNIQQTTFKFGSSAPTLGGNNASAVPAVNLTASPAPSPPVYQFGGNQQASSSSMFSFLADQSSTTTASKVDLKKRVIKKAARRIRNK